MTFLRRHYLWPVWKPGMSFTGRMRWVMWGWWTFDLVRRYRQAHCREHEPISVRVGLLHDLLDGGGHQRVTCVYCGVTIREFSA